MKKKQKIKFDRKFATRFHHQPHDAIFKYYFSQIQYAKELLTNVLPSDIIKSLDLETLEMRPESFVEKDLGMSYSDLLFHCHSNESQVMIYILYEHKSYIDKNTPLQLLKYIIKIWDNFKQANPKEKYPFVLPIVIYHGDQVWHRDVNILSLVSQVSDYHKGFIPKLDYILFDFNSLSNSVEEFSPLLRHVIGLMRDRKNQEKVADWWRSFLAYCESFDIEIWVIYWYITYGTRLPDLALKLLYEEAHMGKLKEVRYEDLQGAAAQEWFLKARDEGLQKGVEEGIQKGIEKGFDQAKYAYAKKLLGKLSDEEISKIVELELVEIKKLRQE